MLLSTFKYLRTEDAAEAAAAPAPATPTAAKSSVLRAKLAKFTELPPLPDTAVRAMALAGDPNAPLSDIATLIRHDGAMATAVLKLANSPLYRTGPAIDNLQKAVLRLGQRGCNHVLTSFGAKSIYTKQSPAIQTRGETLWRHSYFAATLASKLNQTLILGFQGEEFTGTLLHDLGRMVLAITLQELSKDADPLNFHEDAELLPREQATLGINHCELGAEFAQKNRLPESVLSCIQFHHDPAQANGHAKLVALVSTADHVANHVQCESKITNYDAQANPGLACLAETDPKIASRFSQMLSPVVLQAMRETRTLLKAQAA